MSEADGGPRTIVVGGGIAGLVAARRLVLGGRDVLVLEASERWGGQVARHTVAGIELDAAAESFATRGAKVAGLARSLGLAAEIVEPAPLAAWLFRPDGHAIPLPATSVLGIPAVPFARDVIDVIGLRAAFRAQLDLLLPEAVGSRAETLGELVRTRMGRAVVEQLVAPVVRGVHSTTPDSLSVESANPQLRAALRREGSLGQAVLSLRSRSAAGSQVAGIRGGVSRLVDGLLSDLSRFGVEMRLNARVDEARPGAVRVGTETLRGEVLVAAPGVAAARVPGRPVTVVTLVVDAPELDAAPRGTGLLVAAGAPVAARALTHATAKWEWLAEKADGRHVLRLSYDSPPPGGVAQARAEAELMLGVPISTVVGSDVGTWERAAPRTHAVDGMRFVGESGGGTGLASVVDQAESEVDRLLGAEEKGKS